MIELAKMMGRLCAILLLKGILTRQDVDFIQDKISEAEWIEGGEEDGN